MSVLVAGIGNVFHSDDGFGPAVAQRLLQDPPAGATVTDYGVRSVHLAYDLVDGPDHLLLVDAVGLAEAPGTVVVMTPEELPSAGPIDAHGLSVEGVLARARLLGATIGDVRLIGCVPASLDDGMELSPAVAEAVEIAALRIRELVDQLVGPDPDPVT